MEKFEPLHHVVDVLERIGLSLRRGRSNKPCPWRIIR
jgi:hypothetical protein